MQAPYLPQPDATFATWLANFSDKLTASPVTYGLVAGDATTVAAQNTAFQAAYALAIDPATRTSANIAAKDSARAAATAVVRPYAVRISRNGGVTDADKIEIGVNLPTSTRTPVPPPTTQPVLSLVQSQHLQTTLGYKDVTTPASKAKPPGAIGLELFIAIGVAPATDPTAATIRQTITKSPTVVAHEATNVGKIATYWGRWITRSGPGGIAQVGPWSTALVVAIS